MPLSISTPYGGSVSVAMMYEQPSHTIRVSDGGSLAIQAALASGNAASVTIGSVTVSASGSVGRVGTGAITTPSVTASGTGATEGAITGTGAITTGAVTASGAGLRVITGTGAATTPATQADGTGALNGEVTGSAAITTPSIIASGAGVRTVVGSGAVTVGAVTVSASGDVSGAITGTGAANIPSVTASGTGIRQITGTGAASVPAISAAATGVREIVGSGAVTIPSAQASGTGAVGVTGTGAATVPSVTASGTGAVSVDPTISSDSFTDQTISIQGGYTGADNIDLYAALGVSMSLTEAQLVAQSGGTGVDAFVSIQNLTVTANAFDFDETVSAADLVVVTTIPDVDDATQLQYVIVEENNGGSTGIQTLAISGQDFNVTGTSALTVPAVTVSASGTVASDITGTGAGTIGSVTASGSGTVTPASSVTDDFNRADSSLESDAAWTLQSGVSAMAVVSNQLELLTGEANLSVYTHSDTPGSANQYAEMVYQGTSSAGTENRMYIGCRNDTSGNGYFLRIDAGASEARIVEFTGGSETLITFTGGFPTTGQTVRLECNGTTIRWLINGVEEASATNSAHASAGIWALRSYQDGATDQQAWDDYDHGTL